MSEELEIEEDKILDDSMVDGHVVNPFSTKDIKITNATISLSSLISRLEHNEIDLNPDFQRNGNLWNKKQMSRLIESILLKLPLPVFYFDVSDPDRWIVVDGLQRLSTLKKFIVNEIDKQSKTKGFNLVDLEFLDLNGKNYTELDRSFKRIINETQIITYQIEAQTPKEVRYSLFNRINTGGLTLNTQEIRQALNQSGDGVKFLQEISENETFKEVVDLSSKRMKDRELILRYIVFKLAIFEKNKFGKMSEYLDKAMEKLDSIGDNSELNRIKNIFIETLKFTVKIFGEKHKFSRSIANKVSTKTLNQSLFDVITVCFSEIQNKELFLEKKDIFVEKFVKLIEDEQGDFSKAITEGTSDRATIETRFRIMNELIKEVINEN
ncbi:MAG: Unknown protein [uncultured Sulfurovum sp.]|uniref:GmrSD restriction endonucleases N-terminal domain-containing protein n=1 Tax=uncultured Sulfurovum sp. TaxID=269237 RepID=A0A6S6S4N2_9BACT|nr:MAG: Unknown protein [uncultured Sulfurovum sp.]